MAVHNHYEVGDRVKLHTSFPGTNGKVGTISRVDKWEVDVKVGNFTFLIHKNSLEKLSAIGSNKA